MRPEHENSVVRLSPHSVKPPAVRLAPHTSPHKEGGAISVSRTQRIPSVVYAHERHDVERRDLTDSRFSVTRTHARAYVHAQARTSAHARAYAQRDSGGLGRVIDAALAGGDVRVAAVRPSPFLVRLFAFLLLPVTLLAPLAPAYANDAPLSDRVAADVAATISSETVAQSAPAPVAAPAVSPTTDANTAAVAAASDPNQVAAANSVTTPADQAATANASGASASSASGGASTSSGGQSAAGQSGAPASTATTEASPTTTSQAPASSSSAGSGGGAAALIPPTDDASSTSSTTPFMRDVATSTGSSTDGLTDIAVKSDVPVDPSAMADASTTASTTDLSLDPQVPQVADDLQTMREKLRAELHDEVKAEVRKEVEDEVYAGCKNLDGIGYYCVPDAKSFGAPVISNDRQITAVVQPDPTLGSKQIFLVRGDTTIQLTHATDDNIFPVLDPVGDTLVWQSLASGHWQIAYAHVTDPGVPMVHYLTKGDNNFNPKVYGGRIVWQAWTQGTWQIFSAVPSHEHVDDDALSADNRTVGVNGDWDVLRVTANDTSNMFPSTDGTTITWQAIDGGVWQVFAYDIATGVSRRVSKPGVKSDQPHTALVWNEVDDMGQTRMVAADVGGSGEIDLTAIARRIRDHARNVPKTPLTETEIVVSSPPVVKTEQNASSTPTTGS